MVTSTTSKRNEKRSSNNNKNETTPLLLQDVLKPSPNSTDNPSWSNLADCERTLLLNDDNNSGGHQQRQRQGSEISLTSLGHHVNDDADCEYGTTTTLTLRRRRQCQRNIIKFTLLVCLLIAGIFTIRYFVSLPTPSSSSANKEPWWNHHSNNNNKPYNNNKNSAAFSQLDPVHDLGLANFHRPSSSRPASRLLESFISQKKMERNQLQQGNNTAVVAIPTNAWYQNLLSVDDNDMPSSIHRAYTIPYIVDAAGPIAGLRIHTNDILVTQTVIQLNVVEEHGLVVGAATAATAVSAESRRTTDDDNDMTNTRFHVENMTPLAITLGWDDYPMSSPIVKGMPYATMIYESFNHSIIGSSDAAAANGRQQQQVMLLPTVASEVPFGPKESVLVDNGNFQLNCHHRESSSAAAAPPVQVNHEVQIYIPGSDFTWLVFFSEPVMVRCSPLKTNANGGGGSAEETGGSMLQVVGPASLDDNSKSASPFIIRLAILNTCTTGRNPVHCNNQQQHIGVQFKQSLPLGQGDYGQILRSHAHLYPGPDADFSYEVGSNNDHKNKRNNGDDETTAILQFDWDVQDMGNAIQLSPSTEDVNETQTDLIMFSLMHHLDMMGQTPSLPSANNDDLYCAKSLIGPACLIQGSAWDLVDELPQVSFRAPRPPEPWAIQDMANSLRNDITYTLPDYFQRGAGDTYFSGKMVAKLARILLIAEELGDLCSGHFTAWERGLDNKDNQMTSAGAYAEACAAVDLPSGDEFTKALDSLRSSVEVWINGTAEIPFVYDAAWGGVASCGCNFDGTGCENRFPDCPAFENPGLNFGNAFYNDMHFHYGYHIFAAAAVAHFDHDWGKLNFENVLLFIRNIANPSVEDSYFPIMRHKDVFQGHSWASGISRPYLNGKNQESSSEAIAAYESVALYGKVMTEVFQDNHREIREYEVAKAVRGVGKVMTAMELRSAKRYYHVRQGNNSGGITRESEIFPSTYTPHVIGIMWQTMAQFQTWFGNSPYLAYGIQLLPLTSIAEDRDDVEWVKEMYPSLAASCEMDLACTTNGWSVVQLSSLATVGHAHEAFDKALNLSSQVFESAGGNGHSLSNTLWYIATRAPVEEPLPLIDKNVATPATITSSPDHDVELTDCHRPGTCSDEVLNTMANLISCRERIQWVIDSFHKTQKDACVQVAGLEFPAECGSCNPFQNGTVDADQSKLPECPPCTEHQCKSDLNRCPAYEKTFVCTEGRNTGGCAGFPWSLQHDDSLLCTACCELTNCPQVSPLEVEVTHHDDTTHNAAVDDHCPPCSPETCRGDDADNKFKMPQCPVLSAPYLCQSGSSIGGCSPHPWSLNDHQCEKCCKLTPECGQ